VRSTEPNKINPVSNVVLNIHIKQNNLMSVRILRGSYKGLTHDFDSEVYFVSVLSIFVTYKFRSGEDSGKCVVW
jgi:hypothetical protein